MSGELRESIEEIPIIESDTNSDLPDHIDKKSKSIYSCELCGIKVTSNNVLRRHKEGKKHIMKVEREGKTFECELCEIVANSQSQLDAHLRSTRHKNRLYKKEHAHEMINNRGVGIIFFVIIFIFAALLYICTKY